MLIWKKITDIYLNDQTQSRGWIDDNSVRHIIIVLITNKSLLNKDTIDGRIQAKVSSFLPHAQQ